MRSYPNCKINLGLQILSQRPDGYHDIASIMLPVDTMCDSLNITPLPNPNAEPQLKLVGTTLDCPDDKNTCLRAYQLLHNLYPNQVGAVEIQLTKGIPHGAGLGGGSSDAAYTLCMLNELFNLKLDTDTLCNLALKIGADCPFFIHNRPAYITGIGDHIEPIELDLAQLGLRIEVIKPSVSVSTREAYAGTVPHAANIDLRKAIQQPIENWRHTIVNDFETSILPKYPEIARQKSDFYQRGAIYASMSGSGSAVYAFFRN